MSDYGLLVSVREALEDNEKIKSLKMEKSIFYTLPPNPQFPLILLEIDEIWTDYSASTNEALARINFRINMMSQMPKIHESLEIASTVEQVMDGISMRLSPNYLANFRKTGNVIDMPMAKAPRTVQQFYQAIVWRRAYEQYV